MCTRKLKLIFKCENGLSKLYFSCFYSIKWYSIENGMVLGENKKERAQA